MQYYGAYCDKLDYEPRRFSEYAVPIATWYQNKPITQSQIIEFIDDVTKNTDTNKQTASWWISKLLIKLIIARLCTNSTTMAFEEIKIAELRAFNRVEASRGCGRRNVRAYQCVFWSTTRLGPSLFLYHINAITEGPQTNVRLFTDDRIPRHLKLMKIIYSKIWIGLQHANLSVIRLTSKLKPFVRQDILLSSLVISWNMCHQPSSWAVPSHPTWRRTNTNAINAIKPTFLERKLNINNTMLKEMRTNL